jgi:hypothetical protein
MSINSQILNFLSTFNKHCRIRVVSSVLFCAVLFCLMGYWGTKWLHKTPGKTASQETLYKKGVGTQRLGNFHNSNLAGQSSLQAGSDVTLLNPGNAKVLKPSLRLLRIIRFGRSLELVGEVEAGSRLTVNDDPVEVSGDGSFKHFTKPFPRAIKKINLVLKATNLAGKSAELIAPYNFRGRNRDR